MVEMMNDNATPLWLHAEWPAPKNVRTLITTRIGGVSLPPYQSLNLGTHVGDDIDAVAENRRIVQTQVPVPVRYLNQIHSSRVVSAIECQTLEDADASVDRSGQIACAVMTADCLPVLFCDTQGQVVGAAHAGWKGLANGVLEATVAAMQVPHDNVLAYLGPAIGPEAFEVGQDVRQAFLQRYTNADEAFTSIGNDKFLLDIYLMATIVLQAIGVHKIYGGGRCTVSERQYFFSYRRDHTTGRMASIIWLDNT